MTIGMTHAKVSRFLFLCIKNTPAVTRGVAQDVLLKPSHIIMSSHNDTGCETIYALRTTFLERAVVLWVMQIHPAPFHSIIE